MKAVFGALFAGIAFCASIQPSSAVDAAKYTERVLYSFCSQESCADGSEPFSGLINVNGTLYGTTRYGGTGCRGGGCGTVFSLEPGTGTETVVLAPSRCRRGCEPLADLTDVNGTLYGTTGSGGTYGAGTMFSLDPATGRYRTLHDFCSQANCIDGAIPEANLIDVNGVLYGTTVGGGTSRACYESFEYYGCGTVFSLDPATGIEKVLYSFCSQESCTDGAYPYAGLIDVKGTLYGTTYGGGAYCHGADSDGCGTVFSIDPATGAEMVLHAFQGNGSDGSGPLLDGLTNMNGKLYGTTFAGGGTGCYGGYGCGTAFSFDPGTGAELVLHDFQGGPDGANPQGGLIAVKGTLYGTTLQGGGCTYAAGGCGTVFSVDPGTGAEAVLYALQGGSTDGWYVFGGLVHVNGKFYGTTFYGGASLYNGVVFVLEKVR